MSGALSTAQNFFEVLGLEWGFELDKAELEAHYLERAAKWHPDRFVSAGEDEKNKALVESTQLNEAYRALKNPVTRAEHLVWTLGIDLASSDPQKGAPQPDPAFLMEMLERREALQSGEQSLDAALESAEAQVEASLGQAAAAIANKDAKGAAQALVARRYWQRLVDEIEQSLDEA